MSNGEEKVNETKILVSADFKIQGIQFIGAFQKSGNDSWVVGGAKNIKLSDLFPDVPIPDLELDEISCGYSNKSEYFFRTVLGISINLSNLPLVGKVFPPDQTVSIDNLAVMVKGERKENDPKDTGTGAKPTVSIGADINIGGKKLEPGLKLTIGGNKKTQGLMSLNDPPPEPQPETGMTKWFDVNKTFGPVSFKRVGVIYEKEGAKLFFMMDASMAMGPLGVSLAGLGVGSSIKAFKPEFMLEGLGISYSQGGILICGALLYDKAENSFTGMAMIKTPVISLAALGGYQTIEGQASVFIYAVLTSKAGLISVNLGPVFLQINGIAVGFGFNRGLIVPNVDKIKEFPLVSVATGDADLGKDPLDILRKVKVYIPAVKGELFFALGVKFNIQKLIDCFALLIVRIGSKIRLDIVGLAKVALPTEAPVPLAQVEMAYKVTFNIDEGAVQISAVLTPASFIFTKDCRLTGGFAFYAWFYGKHGGDFVLSIGGYHPQFKVPEHYPNVPRAGFQWQLEIPPVPGIKGQFSIKGELYCALIPSGMMAGGVLQAVVEFSSKVSFDIGIAGATLAGMIKASFLMVIDLLMAWQPFSYQAKLSINISIEARFRGEAHFLGFHKTVERSFDLHLSANLQVWGPEFAGKAHVNWSIISFDIAFGKQKKTPVKALKWDDFKNAFLPPADGVCAISVTDGLIREVGKSDEDKIYVVNPAELVLTTNSVIPSTETDLLEKSDVPETGWKKFGIGSMQIQEVMNSKQCFEIKYENNKIKDIKEKFDFKPILKSVPAAIWGSDFQPKLNDKSLLEDMLMGFRITPKPKGKEETYGNKEGGNGSYDYSLKQKIAWQSPMTFKPDEKGEININHPDIINERNKILDVFNPEWKYGVVLSDKITDTFLMKPAAGTLTASSDQS